MFRLIVRRLLLGLLTLLAITVLVFLGTEILPGDVAQAILGQSATPETVAALREKLGLNVPAWERYFNWLGGILAGDLGTSLANGVPVDRIIGRQNRQHDQSCALRHGHRPAAFPPARSALGSVARRHVRPHDDVDHRVLHLHSRFRHRDRADHHLRARTGMVPVGRAPSPVGTMFPSPWGRRFCRC